ncbi:dihydrolipoamide acetyltransferase family protein [Kitasatospora sp. P5_F3]
MVPVHEFALPDLGEGLSDAQLVRWLVAVGDTVATDQPVAEVETAKAVVELPCPYEGVVAELHAAAGDTVPVGRPLLTVRPERTGPVWGPAGAGPVPRAAGPVAPVPPVAVVSPVVRKTARDHGVDLTTLTGTGPGGRIERADVERAIASRHPAPAGPVDGDQVIAVNRAAARKYLRGRAETPHASCWVEADATELLTARRELAGGSDRPMPMVALLARICTTALGRHPALNATVDGEAGLITRHRAIGLGIAVQGPHGLVVPVVHEAGRKSLAELAAATTRVVRAAGEGGLSAAELTGGTFTLNNYGPLAVDGADPILNHPQAAMLGVARITERPWAHQGVLALRSTVRLAVTFDHRVCDGVAAAAFLNDIAGLVERPLRLLSDC